MDFCLFRIVASFKTFFKKCRIVEVWKLQKFNVTLFWQKFRENNVFTKNLKKSLKNCTLWKLRNFAASVLSQNFRQINVLLKNLSITIDLTGKNLRSSEFLVFHSVKKVEILSHQKIFRQINT